MGQKLSIKIGDYDTNHPVVLKLSSNLRELLYSSFMGERPRALRKRASGPSSSILRVTASRRSNRFL